MAINVKDKLVTVESLGVAYSVERGLREEADQDLSDRIDALDSSSLLTEITNARVSGTTTYNNLKARLDADKATSAAGIAQAVADIEDLDDRVEAIENSGGSGGGGSTTLTGLTDTNISNKSDGQVLTYDSTSDKWVNRTPSGGSNEWGTKKALFFGDSIGVGFNNENYSFVDILDEIGFFGYVHKNCVSGSTTPTLHARLIESEAEIATADIIYCEYQYNDIVGLIGGSITTSSLVSSLNTAISYIRARNTTCQIVWMPLTISHFDKVGLTNASYFKDWVEVMYPAFTEYGISILPVYDTAVAGHASSDGRHPNTAGQRMIADRVMQMPLGTTNYPPVIDDNSGSSGGSITVDSALSGTSTNPVQNKVIKQALDSKAGTTVATTSENGLMSSTDKSTLNGHETRITALENGSSGGGSGGGSSTLAGLTDTDISNIADGQVLTYDSSKSKWVNNVPTGGGQSSEWNTKNVLFFGDSVCYGEDNSGLSFADILSDSGFFNSVHKNAVSGSTSITLYGRLQESEVHIANADIIYCEYQYNDITGLAAGTITVSTLVSSLRNAVSYIRARNTTCHIVWMPLTISHFDKVGGANVSHYKAWATAMYPVFAELSITLLPIYDIILDGHRASASSIHPSNVGHQAIADWIMQLPLGTSNYNTILADESGGGSSDQLVTVLYDGNATINTYQGSNYILLNGISDVPAVGDSYRVTWGSASTMLTAKAATVSGTDYVVIGNPGVVGGTDDDSGLTYVAYKSNATQLQFITTDPTGSIYLKVEKYSVSEATTTSAGLMTAEDKQHLDAVYTDYSDMLALI